MRKIERVLLIKPPYTILKMYPKITVLPIGLAYLAATLESDYDVRIIDCLVEDFHHEEKVAPGKIRFGLSWENIRKRIQEYQPDAVGVSCLFSSQIANSLRVLRLVKEVEPEIVTLIGGSHTSALPEETLRNPEVDFAVIGEGEWTLRELLANLNRGESPDSVDGLAFRNGDRIVVNPKTRFIKNLDEIPFPSRHLLPMEEYFKINLPHAALTRRRRTTQIVSSRGCPAHCIFCATTKFWGNRFRGRSAENVLAEIDFLVEKYGIQELHFEDDNLTQDRSRTRRICEGLIEKGYDLIWTTPNGVSITTLDDELIRLMRKSGCYELCLPIESGCQRVLREIIRKPLLLEHAGKVVDSVRKHGIIAAGSFVLGFPGERFEELQQSFEMAWKLNFDNCDFNIATPLPGTRLYEICRDKGLLRDNFSFEKLDYLKGFINMPEFTADELNVLVSVNTMLHRLGLFKRNPAEFFRRYVLLFFKQPRFFFRYTRGLLAQTHASLNRPPEAREMGRRILGEYSGVPLLSRLHMRIHNLLTPLYLIEQYIPRRGAILDLGCGHGLFSFWMALGASGRSVTGVDISGEKVRIANEAAEKSRNLRFLQADLTSWVLCPCDIITIIDVLYLLPFETQRKLLIKCFQALPHGGYLFIHRISKKPLWKFLLARMQEWVSVKLLRITRGKRLYFWEDRELISFLQSLGFRVLVKRLDRGYVHSHSLVVCCRERKIR